MIFFAWFLHWMDTFVQRIYRKCFSRQRMRSTAYFQWFCLAIDCMCVFVSFLLSLNVMHIKVISIIYFQIFALKKPLHTIHATGLSCAEKCPYTLIALQLLLVDKTGFCDGWRFYGVDHLLLALLCFRCNNLQFDVFQRNQIQNV